MVKNLASIFIVILTVGLSLRCSSLRHTKDSPRQTLSGLRLLAIDDLGHVYTVDHQSVLVKFNTAGDTLATFADRLLGSVHSLDVINPQKIFLHYADLNKVIVLDQSLSSVLQYDLENFGLWNETLIAIDRESDLWTYDPTSWRLSRRRGQNHELINSEPVNWLIDEAFEPQNMVQREQLLYLSDPERGWVRLDVFGQFIDFLPQRHTWYEILPDGRILYLSEEKLWTWRPGKGLPSEVASGILNLEKLRDYWLSGIKSKSD